jgi:ATP-dependent DNA helicase RecG
MTAYGDLDISVIKEMPPGRAGVTTIWRRSSHRPDVYAEVRKQLQQGRQAFVVVPFIEESEYEGLKDVVSLNQAVKWAEKYFEGFNIGVLHGRMPEKDKQEIMEKFRLGEYQVLVSTPVIEVGIDVPNATAMIIESADYFGLSQLHQLRGRIGRGSLPGYCYLIADPKTEEAKRRMEILVRYTDGFKIAEEDLKIRGPGELLGTRQHGYWGMRVADLLRDQDLLEPARELAFEFAKRTAPGASRESAYLWDYLEKVFGEQNMNLIVVG